MDQQCSARCSEASRYSHGEGMASADREPGRPRARAGARSNPSSMRPKMPGEGARTEGRPCRSRTSSGCWPTPGLETLHQDRPRRDMGGRVRCGSEDLQLSDTKAADEEHVRKGRLAGCAQRLLESPTECLGAAMAHSGGRRCGGAALELEVDCASNGEAGKATGAGCVGEVCPYGQDIGPLAVGRQGGWSPAWGSRPASARGAHRAQGHFWQCC